jgi:SAM-dependent methyltransferase
MTTDLAAIKARQQEMWASGNYAHVGNVLVLMGELLCEAVDPRAGQRVLDVATGTGNTALSFARRHCDVTGVDYVPALVTQARRRAEAEYLEATFEVGDAEALPFADGAFDVAVSTIGAMFAPDQQRTADELLRVIRSGGKVGMANWAPDSWAGQLFATAGKYLPPPPGLQPPTRWGTEDGLRALFGERVTDLRVTRREFYFRFPTEDYYVDVYRSTFGPVMRAFDTLEGDARDAFERDFRALARRFNRSGDDTLIIPGAYLEVVAVKV